MGNQRLLGISLKYYINNTHNNRWYFNGERVAFEKIAAGLLYENKTQLQSAIRKYGMVKVFKYGLDKLKAGIDDYQYSKDSFKELR